MPLSKSDVKSKTYLKKSSVGLLTWEDWWHGLQGVLMIAGTCIGAGMLALPVLGGVLGFAPTVLTMFFAWIYMTLTGLLVLEASRWFPSDTHLISLASHLLGAWVRPICWVCYVFIAVCSCVAYLSEGSRLLAHLGGFQPSAMFEVFYILMISMVFFRGESFVFKCNSAVFVVLMVLFATIVLTCSPQISQLNLLHSSFDHFAMLRLLPLLVTGFSFPGIVPIIYQRLEKTNVHFQKAVVVMGTTSVFLFYLLWLLVVMGIVPKTGNMSLLSALSHDESIPSYLAYWIQNPTIAVMCKWFGLFAITTSFWGVGWALICFLCDGLSIRFEGVKKWVLVFGLGFAYLCASLSLQEIFFKSLELTGGIGDGFISGFLPVAMVYCGRYLQKRHGRAIIFGGRYLLGLLAAASVALICNEIMKCF